MLILLLMFVVVVIEFMLMLWLWSYIVFDFQNIGMLLVFIVFGIVVLFDIVFVGDNVIIVGVFVVGLLFEQCKKVIVIGIFVVLLLWIVFVVVVFYGFECFKEYGFVFGGGLLLLWVVWKMYCELQFKGVSGGFDEVFGDEYIGIKFVKSFVSVVWVVVVVDVLMSFDNVFVVVGVVCEYFGIMVIGLILLVVMMGVVVNVIVKYIECYCWIVWGGLFIIIYVVGKMIYDGWKDFVFMVQVFMGM